MKINSVDKALEILAWVQDRIGYRKSCGLPTGGADHAADCLMEREALAYLDSVGYTG